MAVELSFDEYDGKYKRIVNVIEIETPIEYNGKTYYESGSSLSRPLMYDDTSFFYRKGLFINDEYYKRNKKKIMDLVIDTVKSSFQDDFTLNGDEFLTDDVLSALCNNKRIKQINLNARTGLSKEMLKQVMDSHLEDINCTVDFDTYPELLYEYYPKVIFNNYPSVCSNTIADFAIGEVNLLINEELLPEEMEQLKKSFEKYPQLSVEANFEYKDQMREIISLINADEILINNQESFTNDDYTYFDEIEKNIMIGFEEDFVETAYAPPSNILEKDNILNMVVSEVKKLDLSTLEQYLYLYNISKMFKEFKETGPGENEKLSRDIIFTMFNDYMVCVGYADLLEEMVKKLDNPDLSITEYSCMIDDNCVIEGHRRCLVKIKDDKYGIDGIYISDPTWDSVTYYKSIKKSDGETEIDYNSPIADYDYYNHFLMTKEEMLDEDLEYVFGDVTDVIFGVLPGQEVSEIKPYVYSETDDAIKSLFHKDNMDREMIDKEIANIKQVPIDSNAIVTAIKNVYTKIYNVDSNKIEELVNSTMNINQEYQQKHFNNTKNKFNYNKSK